MAQFSSFRVPPRDMTNYCHFVAAKPLRPLQPFHSLLAPRGHAGRFVRVHFEIATWGRRRIILSDWQYGRFGFRGVRMIKRRDHSRFGWVAIAAIAGISLLAGIAPSASASDRSAKSAPSCCKQPMRSPCSCCLPVTSHAVRGPIQPSLTRGSQSVSSPQARSCMCQANEVPVPSPKPASTDEGNRTGRDRAEPAERSAVSLANALKSPFREGLIHSTIASPFPVSLRTVRLLI